ncbi:pentatricopeptide repeat-containing protein At4g01990, mitochondrial-like [Triticum dicoccoides]|uniref:pentatricopeptide repeat-containing protein At4g01990, mitochondrial-like n=1 Tax=Triticum dicoccoides TaxID=85692 RepID=UPI00188DE936|nr:pentatricopeptide repeat-containing protein At4g01990, mitochondrial-like [Triticum dicoccoides]
MLRTAATAALRRVSPPASQVPAGFVHAECRQGPILRAAWLPLYRRLSKLPPAACVAPELDRWLRERQPLSQHQLLSYVRKLRNFSDHVVCLQLIDWMEARGACLLTGDHALRLDLVCKMNGLEAAEEYFSSLPDMHKSVKTYSSLLNCYAEHKPEKGLELYEKMRTMNIVPSTLVYQNLMSLYLKAGQPEKVLRTFEEMRGNGIRTDNFTYCILTEGHIMLNGPESTEKFLEDFEKSIPVHWSMYTVLANNYNKVGQFDKAELALKKAEEVMDKGEMFAWHNLLSLYASSGNLSEVKRLWVSLKLALRICSNRSYLVMLSSLKKLDDFDSMQQVFREWELTQQSFDMRIPNVMIQAYLAKDMTDEAEALRQAAMAQGRSNPVTFYIFAESYLEKSRIEAALQVWRDAEKIVNTPNWAPRPELVKRFLKHFEEAKDVDGMESFCSCLEKLECLDADARDALSRTYVAAGRTNPSINGRRPG